MSKDKSKKKKRFLTVPRLLLLVLIPIILLMGVWLALRAGVLRGAEQGIGHLKSQGYNVGHDGVTVTGFPFFLNARSGNVAIQAPMGWKINTSDLTLSSKSFMPTAWTLNHDGDMRVDAMGPGGKRYMFDVRPARLTSSVKIGLNGKVKTASASLPKAKFESLLNTTPPIASLEFTGANLVVKNDIGTIELTGSQIELGQKLPGPAGNILGRVIETAGADIDVNNWSVLQNQGPDTWINDGTAVSPAWHIKWGDADIAGDFDIKFANGLPSGVINVKIKDPAPLIDQLMNAGIVDPSMGSKAKTAMRFMEKDENGRIGVPLTINKGALTFFGQTIARLN